MDQHYYTKIIHQLRDALGLTNNEYAVIDTINRLTNYDGWCSLSKQKIGTITAISRRSVTTIIKKYCEDAPQGAALLEKNAEGDVKTTEIWDIMLTSITVGKPIPDHVETAVKKLLEGEKKLPTQNTDSREETSQGSEKKLPNHREETSHPSIYTNNTSKGTLSLFGEWEETSHPPNEGKNANGEQTWYGKSLQELFDLFWEYYPDRGPKARNPKKRSREYFSRLVKKQEVDPKIIITGAAVFRKAMASKKGEDRRGIPMASTWLNGEEFNDWYQQYEQEKVTPEKLVKMGYLKKEQAEAYSKEQFREPLSRTKTMFKIYKLNGTEYYKPPEDQT